MRSLIISKQDFLREVLIEDVYILKWKIPNTVLYKKRLYGVARKDIEIDSIYMNFSIRGAPFSFYTHSYVFQKFRFSEPGLMMGYINFKNTERLLSDDYLESVKKCPLTREDYVPLKNATKIPLYTYSDEFPSKIPYKQNRSNAFVEELDNLDGKYLDEEFFLFITNFSRIRYR